MVGRIVGRQRSLPNSCSLLNLDPSLNFELSIFNFQLQNVTYFCSMSKKGRVLVAMSGGIDSSVTAVMLHEQGYEVIGLTMKTWDYANAGGQKKETGCCSLDSINDARIVAVELGFPHYIIDIREEFGTM